MAKEKAMNKWMLSRLLCLAFLVAAGDLWAANVSILVDLDPNSTDQTVIVETVTADAGEDGVEQALRQQRLAHRDRIVRSVR